MAVIRPFEPEDVNFALHQQARESWAHGRRLFELLLAHDPDGCFVAVERDRSVGMVTTTRFGASAWIGNLIVEPGFRSRGIGRALMVRGLDHLHRRGAVTIRLDGDPAGLPLYRSIGFVDEFDSCRFALAGQIAGRASPHPRVESLAPGDLDEVAALDEEIFGAPRRRFLELMLACSEIALVWRRNGPTAAYLLASPTDRGLRIGPCVASHLSVARSLIGAAISAAGSRQTLIGVPAPNREAIVLLAEMGFAALQPSLRMRVGPPVAGGDPARLFAISSGATG